MTPLPKISFFEKAVKKAQLRHTLSWPAWLPDCSKHTLVLPGSETQGLQSFHIPLLCLSSKSPPGLGCLKCLQLSPHTSYPCGEEFWCLNGIRAFLFLHWRQEESAGWHLCPLTLFQVGDFTYTPFVHSNCKGAQNCFTFQKNPSWSGCCFAWSN